MQRQKALTSAQIEHRIRAGVSGEYPLGDNLYIRVHGKGKASYRFAGGGGNRHKHPIGPANVYSRSRAREIAKQYAAAIIEGRDPTLERKQARAAAALEAARMVTVTDAINRYYEAHAPKWGAKHAHEWRQTLANYAEPKIGKLAVGEVTTDDVLRVVEPFWFKKTTTMNRVRQRLEAVLDFAISRGWRGMANPAKWAGHLEHSLPRARGIAPVRSHASMPFRDVPALMRRLRLLTTVAARCLEFIILTCSRLDEARLAKFDEINGTVWTVPAQRMKRRKTHHVPLSPRVCEIVAEMRRLTNGEFIFPGRNGAIGETGVGKLLAMLGVADATDVHGLRASFSRWRKKMTSFSWELAEEALSHKVGNSVKEAYEREDEAAIEAEPRRAMMNAWSDFCGGDDNVVSLKRAY
jgi:integrase